MNANLFEQLLGNAMQSMHRVTESRPEYAMVKNSHTNFPMPEDEDEYQNMIRSFKTQKLDDMPLPEYIKSGITALMRLAEAKKLYNTGLYAQAAREYERAAREVVGQNMDLPSKAFWNDRYRTYTQDPEGKFVAMFDLAEAFYGAADCCHRVGKKAEVSSRCH
jgi:hypothetical protein